MYVHQQYLVIGIALVCFAAGVVLFCVGNHQEFVKVRYMLLVCLIYWVVYSFLIALFEFAVKATFEVLRIQDRLKGLFETDEKVLFERRIKIPLKKYNLFDYITSKLRSLRYRVSLEYRHLNEATNAKYRAAFYDIIILATFAILATCYGTLLHTKGEFYQSHQLKQLLQDRRIGKVSLHDIRFKDDFYEFLRKTMVGGLLYYEFPNQEIDKQPFWSTNHVGKIVGLVRLRQIRRAPFGIDNRRFVENWAPERESFYNNHYKMVVTPWVFEDNVHLRNFYDSDFYMDSGYMVSLSRSRENSLEYIDYLQKYNWVTSYTKYIYIDFIFMNIDAPCIILATIQVEFSNFGTFVVDMRVTTDDLQMLERIHILYIILYLLLLISFITKVIQNFIYVKKALYKFWTWVDLLIIFINIALIMLKMQQEMAIKKFFQDINTSQKMEFIHFYTLVNVKKMMSIIVALLSFLLLFRLCKTLELWRIFKIFTETLKHSSVFYVTFMFYLVIFIASMGSIIRLCTSDHSADYSSFLSSMTASLLFSLSFDPVIYFRIDPLMEFFSIFTLFILFLFVAIVASSYTNNRIISSYRVYKEREGRLYKYHLGYWSFLRAEYDRFCRFCRCCRKNDFAKSGTALQEAAAIKVFEDDFIEIKPNFFPLPSPDDIIERNRSHMAMLQQIRLRSHVMELYFEVINNKLNYFVIFPNYSTNSQYDYKFSDFNLKDSLSTQADIEAILKLNEAQGSLAGGRLARYRRRLRKRMTSKIVKKYIDSMAFIPDLWSKMPANIQKSIRRIFIKQHQQTKEARATDSQQGSLDETSSQDSVRISERKKKIVLEIAEHFAKSIDIKETDSKASQETVSSETSVNNETRRRFKKPTYKDYIKVLKYFQKIDSFEITPETTSTDLLKAKVKELLDKVSIRKRKVKLRDDKIKSPPLPRRESDSPSTSMDEHESPPVRRYFYYNRTTSIKLYKLKQKFKRLFNYHNNRPQAKPFKMSMLKQTNEIFPNPFLQKLQMNAAKEEKRLLIRKYFKKRASNLVFTSSKLSKEQKVSYLSDLSRFNTSSEHMFSQHNRRKLSRKKSDKKVRFTDSDDSDLDDGQYYSATNIDSLVEKRKFMGRTEPRQRDEQGDIEIKQKMQIIQEKMRQQYKKYKQQRTPSVVSKMFLHDYDKADEQFSASNRRPPPPPPQPEKFSSNYQSELFIKFFKTEAPAAPKKSKPNPFKKLRMKRKSDKITNEQDGKKEEEKKEREEKIEVKEEEKREEGKREEKREEEAEEVPTIFIDNDQPSTSKAAAALLNQRKV